MMGEKKYFMGVDHGLGDDKSMAIVACCTDEGKIGILRSFEIHRKPSARIYELPGGSYEIPESTVMTIPIHTCYINEVYLRELLLDAERDVAPEREAWPC